MSASKIRVLIVDDSAVIRQIISDNVSAQPGMEVVGTAADGEKALAVLDAVRPDVITLDVQMPRMDGPTTLRAILAKKPVPVIMVSSMTRLGADITLDCLDHGAVDYVTKPDYGPETRAALGDELMRKIRSAAGADVRRILEIREQRKQRRQEQSLQDAPRRDGLRRETPVKATTEPAGNADLADKCIAIGISTGGPPALGLLFEMLKPPMPPIVVVQHMPPHFTKPLAWRLDSLSQLSIKEAEAGDILRPNQVLIAPGGRHLQLRSYGSQVKVVIDDSPPVSGHKPSVDVMMQCAAKIFRERCLGVIMTGMGRDGADGCKAIRTSGGYVFGQDQASSDVYGMNKVAFTEGGIDRQFSLSEAAKVLAAHIRKTWRREPVGTC